MGRGMDKEHVTYRYTHTHTHIQSDSFHTSYINNGILFGLKKNKIISLGTTCMDLEIIMLSELSQKEKDKYYAVTHVWNLKCETDEL